jgi:DNA-binding response OmpR family regulator
MGSPPRLILVVDDEASIRQAIHQVLDQLSELEVHTAASKQEATAMLERRTYDLILTDVVLEETGAGVELLQTVKERSPDTVVILLTGNASVDTAVAALRLGADNFLIKPSSSKEIQSSVINALKRRDEIIRQRELLANIANTLQALSAGAGDAPAPPQTQGESKTNGRYLVVGPLKVDTHTHQVSVGGQEIDLTPTEFSIVCTLAQARGRALTFDEIISTVHGYEVDRDEARDLVRPHIRHIRFKLGDAGRYLHNVRGFGYYLAEE